MASNGNGAASVPETMETSEVTETTTEETNKFDWLAKQQAEYLEGVRFQYMSESNGKESRNGTFLPPMNIERIMRLSWFYGFFS